MDANCIFRLTRTSLHQIPDLSDYFKLDNGLRAKEMTLETSRVPSPHIDVSASQRLSRSSSNVYSSSRMSTTNTRHHSLIALRTHYAYGARSASLSSSTSGRYYSSVASRYSTPDSLYKSNCDSAAFAGRSTNSSSYYRPPTSYLPSYGSNYAKKVSYSPNTYSSYAPRLSLSTSSSYIPTYSYTKGGSLSQNYRKSTASPTYSRNYSRLSPTVSASVVPPSTTTSNNRLCTPNAQSASDAPSCPAMVEKSVQTEQTETDKVVQKVEKPKEESQSDDSSLKAENERLKREMEQLKQQLKEKDRLETEYKRKLLESEAELKVWKNKCELQRSRAVEVKETLHNGLPFELIDQLDSAADRLHKLNAVKDLKRLQEEMESALLEIAHK